MGTEINNFFYIASGFLIPYTFLTIVYKKEINIRLKWMKKKLKGKRIYLIILVIFILHISQTISHFLFQDLIKYYSWGTFIGTFYSMMMFTVLFFNIAYELLGGKRQKWERN